MDAFLRRVVEQREAEQESAIIAMPVAALLRECRVCGRRINGDVSDCRVCAECGGAKVYARLLEQDRIAAAKAHRVAQLLSLAGLSPQPRNPMSDVEPKLCPHCGKKLRADNTRGACSVCLAGGAAAPGDGGGGSLRRRRRRASQMFRSASRWWPRRWVSTPTR